MITGCTWRGYPPKPASEGEKIDVKEPFVTVVGKRKPTVPVKPVEQVSVQDRRSLPTPTKVATVTAPSKVAPGAAVVREGCFKCGQTGHMARDCREEKRVCFEFERTGKCPRGYRCCFTHRSATNQQSSDGGAVIVATTPDVKQQLVEEWPALPFESPKDSSSTQQVSTKVKEEQVKEDEEYEVHGYKCIESELGPLSTLVFQWMESQGFNSFMPTQLDVFNILRELPNVYVYGNNCGSGKTTGAFLYSLMHIQVGDVCVVLIDPSKNLTIQHRKFVEEVSRNKANIQTLSKFTDLSGLVTSERAQYIFVEPIMYDRVVEKLIQDKSYRFVNGRSRILTIMDEAHKIFNAYERDVDDVWNALSKDAARVSKIPQEGVYAGGIVRLVQEMIARKNSPRYAHLHRGFLDMKMRNIKSRIILLAAVGKQEVDVDIDGLKWTPLDVAGELISDVLGLPLQVLKSGENKVVRHVHVFNMHNQGIREIGGTLPHVDYKGETKEVLLVYEGIIHLLLSLLVDGRSMIVCRRSQLESIKKMFHTRIVAQGRRFLFTTDPNQWNDLKYKFIIVTDENLKFLEGSNIPNLKAVYITGVGDSKNFSKIIQAVGRTGRSDQAVSWLFIFADKTTTRNAKIESATHEELIEILRADGHNYLNVTDVVDDTILNRPVQLKLGLDLPMILYSNVDIKEGERLGKEVDMRKEVYCLRPACTCSSYHPKRGSDDFIEGGKLNPQLFKERYRISV